MDGAKLREGDRVSVSPACHWARGATGTIAAPPQVVTREAPDWRGASRTVPGRQGPIVFYWVDFDLPQLDADGDGPFVGAEIDGAFLEVSLEPPLPPSRRKAGSLKAIWYEIASVGLRVEFKVMAEPPADE